MGYSRDPMSLMFYEGQIVNCLVKSTPNDGEEFYSLSTRKSRLKNTYSAKDPEIRSIEDLLPGSLVGGFVADPTEHGIVIDDETKPLEFIEISVSPSIRVVVKKDNFPFDLTAKTMFPGKWIRKIKILSNPALSGSDGEGQSSSVVEGSLKGSDTGAGEMYLKQDELVSVDIERAKRKRCDTEESVAAGGKKKLKTGKSKDNKEDKKRKKRRRKKAKKGEGVEDGEGQKKKKGAEAKENVDDDGSGCEDTEDEEKPVHAIGKLGADLPRLSLDNFQWDFGGSSLGVDKEPISNEALNLDSDEDDDDDVDDNADVAQEEAKTSKDEPATKKEKKKQNAKEKKGGNKGSHVQMMEEESVIAAKEKHLLSDSTPTTADDFERLVIIIFAVISLLSSRCPFNRRLTFIVSKLK